MTFLVLFFVQDCNLVSLRCDLWGRYLGLPFINAYETEGYVLDLRRTAEWRNQQRDTPCGLNKRMTFCVDLFLWPITDQQKVIRSTGMRYEMHPIHCTAVFAKYKLLHSATLMPFEWESKRARDEEMWQTVAVKTQAECSQHDVRLPQFSFRRTHMIIFEQTTAPSVGVKHLLIQTKLYSFKCNVT